MKKKRKRPDEPPPELQINNGDHEPPPRPHPLHQLFHLVSKLHEIDETLAAPYLNPDAKQAAMEEFRFCLGSAESEVERLWVLFGKGYQECYHD